MADCEYPPSLPTGHWATRQIVVAIFIVAFMVVQVGVPTARLFGGRAQRFGWQMFANSGPDVIVVGQQRAGPSDTLDLKPYFAFRRGDLELSYLQRLPAHICRVSNSFEWVAVRKRDGSNVAKATCH
jgi:hypothetical protein